MRWCRNSHWELTLRLGVPGGPDILPRAVPLRISATLPFVNACPAICLLCSAKGLEYRYLGLVAHHQRACVSPQQGARACGGQSSPDRLADGLASRGSGVGSGPSFVRCATRECPAWRSGRLVIMREPFGVLAEGLLVQAGRGDWRSFEPSPNALAPFTSLFLGPLEPHILTVVQHVNRAAQL